MGPTLRPCSCCFATQMHSPNSKTTNRKTPPLPLLRPFGGRLPTQLLFVSGLLRVLSLRWQLLCGFFVVAFELLVLSGFSILVRLLQLSCHPHSDIVSGCNRYFALNLSLLDDRQHRCQSRKKNLNTKGFSSCLRRASELGVVPRGRVCRPSSAA